MIASKEIGRSFWRKQFRGFVKIPLDARPARLPARRRQRGAAHGCLREVIVHGGRALVVPLAAGQRRQDIGLLESYCAAFLEYALRNPHFGRSLRARAAQLLDG